MNVEERKQRLGETSQRREKRKGYSTDEEVTSSGREDVSHELEIARLRVDDLTHILFYEFREVSLIIFLPIIQLNVFYMISVGSRIHDALSPPPSYLLIHLSMRDPSILSRTSRRAERDETTRISRHTGTILVREETYEGCICLPDVELFEEREPEREK